MYKTLVMLCVGMRKGFYKFQYYYKKKTYKLENIIK